MSTQGFTKLLKSEDSPYINKLRFSDLANEGTFVAKTEAVKWSQSDEISKVLGIYDLEGALLSTLRLELMSRAEELPPKLDFDTLHEHIMLPCGLLGKAVTAKTHQGQGLHSYLRALAYEYFHSKNIQFVVGTVMPNAARVPQLRTLGYKFIENPEGWRRYGYNSFGPTLVCYLDLKKNYDRVMTLLNPKIEGLRKRFPIETIL